MFANTFKLVSLISTNGNLSSPASNPIKFIAALTGIGLTSINNELTNSFKLFDQNMALTNGEPMNSTTMLALNIYKTFYGRAGAQWKGLGQAKAVVFCILVVAVSFIQLRATRSKEVQQ